jgi:hypothetical protein
MGYNMKRGVHPLFKDLGSSDAPLKKASPMKHPHWGSVNHSARSHWDDFTSSVSDVASDINDWGYKNITKPVGEAAEFVADNASDLGHGALDIIGTVPGFGEPADLLNAAWYSAEGDYENAATSTAAALPFFGWAASGKKAKKYYDKYKDYRKSTKEFNKRRFSDAPTLGGKDSYLSQGKQLIANNPITTSAGVAYVGSNLIDDFVEGETEKLHTKQSVKYGEITSDKTKRSKIEEENINQSFKNFGWDRKEMETKRNKYYSDFKKANPDLEKHPYNYLTDKSSEHYSADFSLLQNQIYRGYEGGISNVADTSKGNPTLKHK